MTHTISLNTGYFLFDARYNGAMDKKTVILPFLSVAMLLSCGAPLTTNYADEAKFKEAWAAMKARLIEDGADFDNVKTRSEEDKTIDIDYKKGEFYYYHNVRDYDSAMHRTIYTWKEGGQYYHVEEWPRASSKNISAVITETEFNQYMAAGRAEVNATFLSAITDAERIMNSDFPAKYAIREITNRYFIEPDDVYKLDAQAELTNTETNVDVFTFNVFWFDSLPRGYADKEDGGSRRITITYGDASFTKPSTTPAASSSSDPGYPVNPEPSNPYPENPLPENPLPEEQE